MMPMLPMTEVTCIFLSERANISGSPITKPTMEIHQYRPTSESTKCAIWGGTGKDQRGYWRWRRAAHDGPGRRRLSLFAVMTVQVGVDVLHDHWRVVAHHHEVGCAEAERGQADAALDENRGHAGG